MNAPEGNAPIADDELLLRRIPASTGWIDDKGVSSLAFRPNRNDGTGLSISRAEPFKTVKQAARGRPGKSYYVAVLRAGDLRRAGIEVRPAPLPDDPGHAELPDLTYQDRKTDDALQWADLLANELILSVEGPFASPSEQ